MSTWRPITQTSPPWDGKLVLVWQKQGGTWISGRFKDSKGYGGDWYLGGHRFPPIYWMPLPEPPCPETYP